MKVVVCTKCNRQIVHIPLYPSYQELKEIQNDHVSRYPSCKPKENESPHIKMEVLEN